MQTTFKLDPDVWYPEDTLRLMGLDGDHLRRARESGQLRCTDKGGVIRYKGAWVLAWLESEETPDA